MSSLSLSNYLGLTDQDCDGGDVQCQSPHGILLLVPPSGGTLSLLDQGAYSAATIVRSGSSRGLGEAKRQYFSYTLWVWN